MTSALATKEELIAWKGERCSSWAAETAVRGQSGTPSVRVWRDSIPATTRVNRAKRKVRITDNLGGEGMKGRTGRCSFVERDTPSSNRTLYMQNLTYSGDVYGHAHENYGRAAKLPMTVSPSDSWVRCNGRSPGAVDVSHLHHPGASQNCSCTVPRMAKREQTAGVWSGTPASNLTVGVR